MSLRLGTVKDRERFVEYAYLGHLESCMSRLPFSESKTLEFYDAYLQSDKTRIVVIFEDHGVLAAIAQSPMHLDGLVAHEICCYSSNRKEILRLYRAYEAWALRVGCVVVQKAVQFQEDNKPNFNKAEEIQLKWL